MRKTRETEQFDRALLLRDSGDLDGAHALLKEIVEGPGTSDPRLHVLALLQLGHVLGKLGRHAEAIAPLRAATEAAPRMELASLALFHALEKVGDRVEALCEAFRLLTLRESLGYRELFAGDAFRDEVGDAHELAEQARVLLAAHRDVQRRRSAPMPGDTVRVRAAAPADSRPGSLAVIRGVKGPNAFLSFTDGVWAEVELALVDHHDL